MRSPRGFVVVDARGVRHWRSRHRIPDDWRSGAWCADCLRDPGGRGWAPMGLGYGLGGAVDGPASCVDCLLCLAVPEERGEAW